VLDADVVAGMRIGPTRDIAGGINTAKRSSRDSGPRPHAIDREPGLLGQCQARPHADADDHKAGFEHATVFERRAPAIDCVTVFCR